MSASTASTMTVFNRFAEGFDTAYLKEAKRLLDASALRRCSHTIFTVGISLPGW
jgi:hypothetical protein